MLTLFQRETCPYCQPVRQRLTELGITYINVNEPKPRDERHTLIERTGSHFIPALIDAVMVLPGRLEDNSHILQYIEDRYGSFSQA